MGSRVEEAAGCILHELKDGGEFEVAVEISVALEPASTDRLPDEPVLQNLQRGGVEMGGMSKRDRCVGHDGANASLVKCHLISKGHFTVLAQERMKTAQDKGCLVPDAPNMVPECESVIESDA